MKKLVFPAWKVPLPLLLFFFLMLGKEMGLTAQTCILLQNVGFESDLTGWSTDGTDVTITTDVHSGAKAAKILGSWAYFYQNASPVTVGATYYLDFWAKVEAPYWERVTLEFFNSSWGLLFEAPCLVTNTGSYKKYTISAKAPTGAVYLKITASKGEATAMYLDDFCLYTGAACATSGYTLGCGCGENMAANGSFELSQGATFNYSIAGSPAALVPNGNYTMIPPWVPGLSSPFAYYINDSGNTVNNPDGSYFIYLPAENDCWTLTSDFSTNLDMVHGEEYEICFYAAAWKVPFDASGYPTGGSATQTLAGGLKTEFVYRNSGFTVVNAHFLPIGDSWANMCWQKCSHKFIYDVTDPVDDLVFTVTFGVGIAIDGVEIHKTTNCPPTPTCPTGTILLEEWKDIYGTVFDLKTNENYPSNPNHSQLITSFRAPTQWNSDLTEDFGVRVRGYLNPTESGTYYFNVTADDYAELYLSTSTNEANKTLIASVPGWVNPTDYTTYPQQTSAAVTLTAGNRYYIELLFVDIGSIDHFQVHWKTPSVPSTWNIIPGAKLSPHTCRSCDLRNVTYWTSCNDNGTPSNLTDDQYGITIYPEGEYLGTTFKVTGGTTLTGQLYGRSPWLGYFPASATNQYFTVTDETYNCSFSFIVDSPPNCAVGGNPDRVCLPTNGYEYVQVLTNDTGSGPGCWFDWGWLTVTSGPSHGIAAAQNDGTIYYEHDGTTFPDQFTYSTRAVCDLGYVDKAVLIGSDDAKQSLSTGAVDISAVDLDLGKGYTSSSISTATGIRFQALGIPKNAIITSAYIKFIGYSGNVSTTANLQLWAQAADNASTFTTATNNISNRTKTAASVAWSNLGQFSNGYDYYTPELKTLVQEVVNRAGWTITSAMAFIVQGDHQREVYSYNGNTSYAPRLYVEWYTGSAISSTVTVTQSCFQNNCTLTVNPTANLPCTGQTLNLAANRDGGTAPFTWVWSGANNFYSAQENPSVLTFGSSEAGYYNITVTDAAGCTATQPVNAVIQLPPPKPCPISF